MNREKILLYGYFGSGNLGNDGTFEAALFNIRRRLPTADILSVCSGPENVTRRFGVPACPIKSSPSRSGRRSWLNRLVGPIRRIFVETAFLLRTVPWCRSVRALVVVGTGAVDDMAVWSPWGSPFELLKWCLAAKLGGARIVFLSVGVGPIENPISRFLMLWALRLADTRSYRETAALDYLRKLGFDTRDDRVYPDLVFGLDTVRFQRRVEQSGRFRVVGLGVINYRGWRHETIRGEPVFRAYMGKVQKFLRWLLQSGYKVQLLTGDTTDQVCVDELTTFMASDSVMNYRDQFSFEPAVDLNQLLEQIAGTDVVVASRFHNVLCSLIREKPTLSIGYHAKNDLLMESFGFGEYCQRIDSLDVDRLIKDFKECESRRDTLTCQIRGLVDTYRRSLGGLYDELLSTIVR